MKKKSFKSKINSNKLVGIILVVCILFMSIGYSVFNSNLMVDNITAVVRPTKDIRVTGANASNFTNQAMIDWVDYNVKSISSSVVLPQQDSTVTFKVQITNIGSIEMGIFNISGLPDNLEYSLSDYTLKEKLCNENICSLGMQKYITITIKYKYGSPIINSSQSIKLDFDFRPFHKITYDEYIPDNNYPKEVIDGDTYKMSLVYPYPIGAKPFSANGNVTYKYDGDTLIVENVTSDLIVKSGYIQSIEDLVSLSSYVNDGNDCSGRTFTLEKDLDFKDSGSYRNSIRTNYENISGNLMNVLSSGTGWIPIGTTDYRFKGIFDGKEKTISNIYVDNKTFAASVGFFGAIEDATIKNLKLGGNITTETNANMGSISGRTYGNVLIDNVENHVNVTGFSNSGSNGGIFGSTNYPANITLKNIKNYGNISYGNQSAGLIGWVESNVTIENCHNFGKITLSNGLRAGGLVGASSVLNNIYLIINNSSNNGTIYNANLDSSNSGGIIGYANSNNNKQIIINSYNTGEVTGYRAGGIIGYSHNSTNTNTNTGTDVYIYNSANIADIHGTVFAGGIVGESNYGLIKFKNVYNVGSLQGTEKNEVVYITSKANITIDSVYYTNENPATNLSNIQATAYSKEDMRLQTFVDKLNEYVTSHQSETILDKEYQLSNWEINGHEYPTPKN